MLRIGTRGTGLCLVLLKSVTAGEGGRETWVRTVLLEGALIRSLAAYASDVFADVVFGVDVCGRGAHTGDCACYWCCCAWSAHVV